MTLLRRFIHWWRGSHPHADLDHEASAGWSCRSCGAFVGRSIVTGPSGRSRARLGWPTR